jgi:shikimate dehydrogenase
MLQGDSLRSRIEELMSLRSETYESTAHITIETDGKSIEAIAEEIFHILNN